MLTREQLLWFSRKNSAPLATQERDYLQALFLSQLFSKKIALIFKGGTALRFVLKSGRFSDDLDFTAMNGDSEKDLKKAVLLFGKIGIEAKLELVQKYAFGKRFKLRFRGPLYTGDPRTAGSINIDVSFRRDYLLEPEWNRVETDYPDVPPFSILMMQPEEILAEKIRALLIRAKSRDLYDVWFLLRKGLKPNFSLINRKLALYSKKFKKTEFRKSMKRIGSAWERDMKRLMLIPPDFPAISREVLRLLQ